MTALPVASCFSANLHDESPSTLSDKLAVINPLTLRCTQVQE